MSNYKLRAHHGLCIQFFEGKGYSDSFTSNMSNVINNINNDLYIQIVTNKDVICNGCPNLENDVCNSQHKVGEIDKKVLTLCGFKENEIIKAKDFFQRVNEKIIKANKLKEVCKNCEWLYICGKNKV